MLYLILQGLWFMLPAMFSNMAPMWAAKLKRLDFMDVPIDQGKKWHGEPIFGRNKTVRGFVAGAVFALTIGLVQYLLSAQYDWFNRLEFFELGLGGYIVLAFLLGIGALVGDAVESFAKRRINKKPGEAWFPFDQIDYVVGALFFSLPIGFLAWEEYVAAAFVAFTLHPISTFIGWKIGMKDAPI